MLSDKRFTYYQPEAYYDDGTNVDYGPMPLELHSFQAFPTREECEEWLKNNGYEPGDFCISEYEDDDIEEVTLIDRDGNIIPHIEVLEEDELVDLIGDEAMLNGGGMALPKQEGECEQEYEDRVYAAALDLVNAAIISIEESGEYNFQSYCGTPEVEWYDEARDWAVKDVMGWITGE